MYECVYCSILHAKIIEYPGIQPGLTLIVNSVKVGGIEVGGGILLSQVDGISAGVRGY